MKVVCKRAIGDVVVYQKKPSRIAAIAMELHEIRVINGGEDQDLVAEGLGGEGSAGGCAVVVPVQVFDRDDSTVVEMSQVH